MKIRVERPSGGWRLSSKGLVSLRGLLELPTRLKFLAFPRPARLTAALIRREARRRSAWLHIEDHGAPVGLFV